MKKIISVILSLCLLLSVSILPVSVSADTVLATGGDGKVELTYYGGNANLTFAENMSSSTYRFMDRTFAFDEEFPSFLSGATYLQTAHDDKAHANYIGNDTWISVKLYESATVYYLTQANNRNTDGSLISVSQPYLESWSSTEMESGWMTGETQTTLAGDTIDVYSKDGTEANLWLATTASTSWNVDKTYIFKREIKVPAGQSVTLDFPAPGVYSSGSAVMAASYSLAFQFHGNSHIKVEEFNGVENSLTIVDNMNEYTNRFWNSSLTNTSEVYNFSLAYPEVLEGATYVTWERQNTQGSTDWITPGNDYITLTFDRPSTMYLLTGSTTISDTYMSQLKDFQALGGDWVRDENGSAKLWNVYSSNNAYKGYVYLFKCDIEVKPGETKTITYKTPGASTTTDGFVYSLAFQWKDFDNLYIDAFYGNSDSLTVTDNMTSATKRFWASDSTDTTQSFDFSLDYPEVLEGATYVTWDINSASNETFNTVNKDWLTVTLYKSASVYVLAQQQTSTEEYMPWLSGYYDLGADWVRDDEGNAKNWMIYNNNWRKGSIYLFKIDIPVKDGSSKTITFPTAGAYPDGYGAPVYSLAFQWSDAEVYDVTISSSGNGQLSRTGAVEALAGQTVRFTADADTGHYIEKIEFNGEEQAFSGTAYTTLSPAISEDTTIVVTFAEKIMPENMTTYTNNVFASASETFMAGDEEITAPTGILFAKAEDAYGEMVRQSCGMIFSKTPGSAADIIAESTERAEAEATAAYGNYGIRFYGNGIVKGGTYYALPYAVYTDGTETVTLYGSTVLTFTVPNE